MPLYHINVPQYDDDLNNVKYFKYHMVKVIKFSNDFPSVKHK